MQLANPSQPPDFSNIWFTIATSVKYAGVSNMKHGTQMYGIGCTMAAFFPVPLPVSLSSIPCIASYVSFTL